MAYHDRLAAICENCRATFAALRISENEIHVLGTTECPDCGGEEFSEFIHETEAK